MLSKTSVQVNGEEQLLNCDDTHVVFTRPNAFVESSGTTWANETQRLRCLMPDTFEVNSEDTPDERYTKNFRSICADLKDNVTLFKIMTVDEDIQRVSKPSPDAKYVSYEVRRLMHLNNSINRISNCDFSKLKKTLYASNVLPIIQEISICTKTILMQLERNASPDILPLYTSLCNVCQTFIEIMTDMALPIVKPRWFENSDAGPGVGVSNFEVKFRDAELSILYMTGTTHVVSIQQEEIQRTMKPKEQTMRLATALLMVQHCSGISTQDFTISVMNKFLN